jgi:hypothetical protein
MENPSEARLEYIYIFREREFVKTKENIFKIGRTSDWIKRYKQYPKGSELLFVMQVSESIQIENKIISILKECSTQRLDIGREYFEGEKYLIMEQVLNVCKNNNQIKEEIEEVLVNKEDLTHKRDSVYKIKQVNKKPLGRPRKIKPIIETNKDVLILNNISNEELKISNEELKISNLRKDIENELMSKEDKNIIYDYDRERELMMREDKNIVNDYDNVAYVLSMNFLNEKFITKENSKKILRSTFNNFFIEYYRNKLDKDTFDKIGISRLRQIISMLMSEYKYKICKTKGEYYINLIDINAELFKQSIHFENKIDTG